MSTESIDYSAVLADLEAKRAALDAMILNLRLFLAGQTGASQLSSGSGVAANSTGEVPAGAFLGKSIPDAVKLYLQIMKRKATTREIAEALRRGGMESTSNNFNGIVHAVINRYWKGGGDIIKLDKSTWGLAAWYPSGVRATVPEKRPTGKKRGPKAKATKRAKEPAEPKRGLEQQIEAMLLSDRSKVFSVLQIAQTLGVKTHGLPLTLGRMVKKNKAERTGDGYRAFSSGKSQGSTA
jgi:hypothetical protein